jgi:cyclic 2,3-diphosphoglycerate synthetase
VDLSDEPILDYVERFRYISFILSCGLSYIGAYFRFEPPVFEKILRKPSLAVIGTGKRVGKTAICGFVSRSLVEAKVEPCVIAMGRGGPPSPEVLLGKETDLLPEYLLNLSKAGKHAASDYFEDALTSRITTIGCRRCGGGLAGAPFFSNVVAGAKIANDLPEKIVILEGSGATLPPVKADRYLLVIGAGQPLSYIENYLGTYRILLSDLVVLTMCELPVASANKIAAVEEAVRKIKPKVKLVKTVFRPKPLGKIRGKKVFVALTSTKEVNRIVRRHLEEVFEAEVVGMSNNLADRERLQQELANFKGKVDVLLTELKAAAVDLATKMGLETGIEVVYLDNEPISIGGDGELKDLVIALANEAIGAFKT